MAEINGQILSGHCDCKAGWGQTCSHIASLLWTVAAGVERRSSLTVTQKSAYWVMPPPIKHVEYKPIGEISFTGLGRKRKYCEGRGEGTSTGSADGQGGCNAIPRKKVTLPSSSEKEMLFNLLSQCENAKPAVLAAVSPYHKKYIPATIAEDLPTVLSGIFKKENLSLRYDSLVQLAKNNTKSLTVTRLQADAAERKTRAQSKSRIWFGMRAGRITASKFRNACHTDPASPSVSLIMSVCYPELLKFTNKATRWGCQHENVALQVYSHQSEHDSLKVSSCGVFISTEYPFLAASPDGIVQCDCCGTGICEVKVRLYTRFSLLHV